MKRLMKHTFLFTLLLVVGGCSFVKLTPGGENVAVLQANQVGNCDSQGSINVAVTSKVVVNRDPAKVAQDLRTLARNRAASLGGDTLVAAGSPSRDGQQTFNIYRCRR